MTLPADVEALRPCPFCGFKVSAEDADSVYPWDENRSHWNVHCYQSGGGCGAVGPHAGTRDKAISVWNRFATKAGEGEKGPMRCSKHGGYGFSSDCPLCAAPTTGSPAPSRDEIVEECARVCEQGWRKDRSNLDFAHYFHDRCAALVRTLKSVPNAQGEDAKKMKYLEDNLHQANEDANEYQRRMVASERRCAELEKDARPPEGWTSVEERLPENPGSYLVNLRGGKIVVADWYLLSTGTLGTWSYQPATHWQPLPQPPVAPKGG